MQRKHLVLLAAVALVILGLLFLRHLLRAPRQTQEQRLMALAERMAAAAEQRDIKEMREHLARDYRDREGRDYAAINQLLRLHYLRQGVISVYLASNQVQVDHEAVPLQARMTATVVLTRGPRVKRLVDIVPHSARALRFEIRLRKADVWQVVAAHWTPIDDLRDVLGQ
jgi:hypothetical protein